MIDVWLIFCQLVPFIEVDQFSQKKIHFSFQVFLLTALEYLSEENIETDAAPSQTSSPMAEESPATERSHFFTNGGLV